MSAAGGWLIRHEVMEGFWWVFMSSYFPHKQYDCKIGAFFIENCPSGGCWEPRGGVGGGGFKEMPLKQGCGMALLTTAPAEEQA